MKQTVENVAAIYCRDLAKAADRAAYTLRDVGTKEARQHAREAQGAAKIARQWARELEKQHRAKQKGKARELNEHCECLCHELRDEDESAEYEGPK